MAINTVNDIAQQIEGTPDFYFLKTAIANIKAVGSFESLWLGNGNPSAGQGPPIWTSAGSGVFILSGSGTLPGYVPFQLPRNTGYLAEMTVSSTIAGTLIVADRLWAAGGFGWTANGSVIPNPWDLPARITDSGCGCELWMEIYNTAMGNASGSLTAIYTNPAGTGSRIGVINAVVSAPSAGQLQPVQLQQGDYGIKQLNAVALSATSTSGSFGMTILKRIAEIPIYQANYQYFFDWASLGLPIISPSACLMFIWQGAAVNGPTLTGTFDIIDR